MPSQKEIDAYCMGLFAGDLWTCAKILNQYAGAASVLADAARQRYLKFEYAPQPIRRYEDVSVR
jgi:hypothetical protein